MSDGWKRAGVAVLLAASTQSVAAPDDPLAAHRWRSRPLVIGAPAEDDAQVRAQRAVLDAAQAGGRERDLVILEAVGPGRQADVLRRRLGLPGDRFAVVLLGKDGGAKLRSDAPIPAERLFAVIDAMPMRQDEMRRRCAPRRRGCPPGSPSRSIGCVRPQ